MVDFQRTRKIRKPLNDRQVALIQWGILVVFFLFFGLLIDYRLRKIEDTRCDLWEWEVCANMGEDYKVEELYFVETKD